LTPGNVYREGNYIDVSTLDNVIFNHHSPTPSIWSQQSPLVKPGWFVTNHFSNVLNPTKLAKSIKFAF